jgi:hypothetical protein
MIRHGRATERIDAALAARATSMHRSPGAHADDD